MSTSDVLKMIKDKEAEFVDLRFTDPRGKLQHLTMDATIVDEDNVNQKKPKKQFSFFNRQQNNNIVVEYEDIEVDKSEVFYDGQLLDIAVKKKIIKKKGNWYLYGDEKLGYGKRKS